MTTTNISASSTAISTLDFDKAGVNRLNKANKSMGTRWHMAGEDATPKAIADRLKATAKSKGLTLSNKQLKAQVNAVRRGDKVLAWANFDVAIAAIRAKGVIPQTVDLNAKETTYTAKFDVVEGAAKATAAEVTKASKDLSKEEKAELLKALQAELASEVDAALNANAITI